MEETAVLIERSQAGDKTAREKLIEENLGLVRHIVKRFIGRGYDAEDLFQIGCIGLMKAIDKFDLSFAVRFSTYAVPMIQGEIKRFLRDDGMVKVSRTLKENAFRIRQVTQRLLQELGRDPTMQELADASGLLQEDIVMSLDASEIYLVDQVIGQNGGVGRSAMGQEGLCGSGICEDPEKERILDHMLLSQLLEGLDERERELIRMRYFQDKTQVEVARYMGISQVQVSRMEKKILCRMRARARE